VQPELVVLGLDSMVMDNDQAKKRHGVKPTYKKVKGFQPLQLVWEQFIIDAVFRRGDRHCNYGEDLRWMIRRAVEAIFCQPMYEDRQRLLEFARPDTVIYTNLSPSITAEARMS